jgi:glycosyltransferase involved in cell wall biosynthesis
MDMTAGITVVVPVYNSQTSLEALAARLEPVLRAQNLPFEVLLVNDGSKDQSWEVVTKLAAQQEWVRGINMMRNYGQHNALLCGIREARYDTIVTLDDDLQNPPEEIPQLLAKLGEGFDVVYGKPRREQHGLFRDLASQLTKMMLQNAMGVETARSISSFRVFRTRLRQAFGEYRSPLVSVDVLLTWATSRFAAIRVRHDPRTLGASTYTLRKLVVHAMNLLTGFSTWPLRVASIVGFAFTGFGMAVLAYVLVSYALVGSPVSGFPFLASVIAIFAGAQLFALGIMGEYLARIHQRLMERPPFTVGGRTGAFDESKRA